MNYKPLRMMSVLVMLAVALAACASLPAPDDRATRAQEIAAQAGMTGHAMPAGPFTLQVYEHPGAGGPATVYIEGDGLAWMSRGKPSPDPTPTDPVALRLAAAQAATQPAAHIVYIARPCQYVRTPACGRTYWTDRRFAPVVIAAYGNVLNTIAAPGYNLVGFSGGGAVAALLAARRGDVLSLRTVAGNLDHATHSVLHGVSPLAGSLNPVDDAAALRAVPQRHFTGANDSNVPDAIYQSYARALGPTPCLHHAVVPGATHEAGWVAAWPALLAQPVACR
jgi:hypothetical protein